VPLNWPKPLRTQALIVTAVILMYALVATGSVHTGETDNEFVATSACHCATDAQPGQGCVHDQMMHCPTYSACAGGMCATLPVAIAFDSVLATMLAHTPDHRAHHSLSAPPQRKPPAII